MFMTLHWHWWRSSLWTVAWTFSKGSANYFNLHQLFDEHFNKCLYQLNSVTVEKRLNIIKVFICLEISQSPATASAPIVAPVRWRRFLSEDPDRRVLVHGWWWHYRNSCRTWMNITNFIINAFIHFITRSDITIVISNICLLLVLNVTRFLNDLFEFFSLHTGPNLHPVLTKFLERGRSDEDNIRLQIRSFQYLRLRKLI